MNSNFEAIVTVVNGGLDDSNISQISAEKVTSGEFDPDRIPRLSEAKLPQAAQGFLKAKGATADPAYELVQWGDVQAKPSTFPPAGHKHSAGDIDSGTFANARIPNLDASKITSGIFHANRVSSLFAAGGTINVDRANVDASRIVNFNAVYVPNLDAAKITSGTFHVDRIPSLAASKITSGTLDSARIPNLNASKITAGTFNVARIPTGTSSSTVALGNHSHTPASIGAAAASHTHSWDSITSKPTTFPPSAHSADLLTSGTVPAARLPSTITGSKTFSSTVTFQHNATFQANTSFNGPVSFGTNGRLILPSSW